MVGAGWGQQASVMSSIDHPVPPVGCTIRPARPDDREAVAAVVAAAFASPAEARLVEALREEPG